VSAGQAAFVLVLAYLLVTPYALPWYDGLAWALAVLLPLTWLDLVLIAHTTVLSLAYIPGRDVALPHAVDTVTSAVRDTAAPTVLGLLVVIALVMAGGRWPWAAAGAPLPTDSCAEARGS
jgi:hypothetical protein